MVTSFQNMKGDSAVERPCPCFLCNGNADVYCESDSAFLCFSCDSSIHSANFLVARHIRRLLCLSCRHLSAMSFSGPRSPPLLLRFSCRSCSPNTETDHEDEEDDNEDSISCVSSTETTPSRAGRRGDHVPDKRGSEDSTRSLRTAKAEGIFVNWCRNLGLHRDSILPAATQAIGLPSLPFRVGLAVSFWYGVRSCGVATWRNLRRLEEVSGVPGKLIVAVEMKLERALRLLSRRRRRFVAAAEGLKDLEEGWAEC